jgi:hypothetical protein
MLRSQAYLAPDLVKALGKQKPKVWHEGLHQPIVSARLHARAGGILAQPHQAKRKPPTLAPPHSQAVSCAPEGPWAAERAQRSSAA